MDDDADLAAWQAGLLEVLARGGDPKEAKAALSENKTYASYVETFDLRMMELGMSLVAKWGRRRS